MWEAFTIFWFFVLGCCVGSFLNVVIYRLPAGLNLSQPGSHCPRCKSPIRAWHNIPLLGWLWLRGRCADCALPIPVRYPLVELTGGLLATVLVLVEVLTAGANLPGGPWYQRGGVDWMIWSPQWDLLGIYLLHCVLLGCLLPAALIAYDGQELPRPLWLLPLMAGVNCGIAWPHLLPVPAFEYPELMSLLDRQWTPTLEYQGTSLRLSFGLHVTGFTTTVSGALLGALLAAFLYRRLASPWPRLQRARSVVYLLPAVGAVLGWQAVVCVTVLMLTVMCLDLVMVRNQPVRVLLGFSLLGSTLGFILCWKPLWNLLAPLGPDRLGLLPVGILLTVGESLLLSRLAQSRPDEEPPPPAVVPVVEVPPAVLDETPASASDSVEAPVSP